MSPEETIDQWIETGESDGLAVEDLEAFSKAFRERLETITAQAESNPDLALIRIRQHNALLFRLADSATPKIGGRIIVGNLGPVLEAMLKVYRFIQNHVSFSLGVEIGIPLGLQATVAVNVSK